MSVSVIGCGRSGTNMVLEILRGNDFFNATKEPEDKTLFKRNALYPNNYLTKCDTAYFSIPEFNVTLERNQNMQIIWTIRDPRDMILSKIRRGQPRPLGGDCRKVAEDATPDGCIADLQHMFKCYLNAIQKFSNRVLLVKMESVILSIEEETKKMCKFIGVQYYEGMCNFVDRIRVPIKKERYNCLDKDQIGLWKRRCTIYDGFFNNDRYPIDKLFAEAKSLISYFNYETIDCH